MPFIQTSTGARLHYEDAGQGEHVIALHGLLGTARVDLGQVIDALAPHYLVIAPTLRGYGESYPKPRDFSPGFYHRDAEDVLALMDALGLAQAHIIGYSDGGEVALIAATQQPERFKSVAVWGSTGIVPASLRPDPNNPGAIPGVDDIRRVASQLHGITHPEAALAQWISTYTQIIDDGGDLSLSQAHRLTMPLLMMIGAEDAMAPQADAEAFVRRAPSGQLRVFAGGHAVHQEHLADLIAALRGFWQTA